MLFGLGKPAEPAIRNLPYSRAARPCFAGCLLRHSAARAVLSAGGSLTEVGELLGHANGQVTMAYASFDLRSLAVLARPWPVEVDHA